MPDKFISNKVLLELINKVSRDERLILTKIIDPKSTSPYDPSPLQQAICEVGGHGLMNWMRGQGTGYLDILDDVAEALDVKSIPSYRGSSIINGLSVAGLDELDLVNASIKQKKINYDQCLRFGVKHAMDVENKILINLLEKAYNNMTTEQKADFDNKLIEVTRRFGESSGKGLAGTAGLMVLGNLGGFATYTLMSTVLSTVTFGALGFGAYTAASSILSVVLGPVGWLAMGGAAIHAIGKPKLAKTIPLVANIAVIRQRITHQN